MARNALVVYGSETGNAQDLAEELGRLAQRLRFDTHVADLNSVSLKSLLQHSVVLVAISTTGQGELPPNSQAFWKALRSARLPPGCLKQMRFASFGLGDTSYPKFNWAHRKLYNRLTQLGAQPVCDRGESDEQHPEGIDASFLPWTTALRKSLLEAYPLPDGQEPIPDDVLLDPKWILGPSDAANGVSHDAHAQSSHSVDKDSSAATLPPPDLLPIPNGLVAEVVSNHRVTPTTHWQDVRHLKFDLHEHRSYLPGDVLTIYPKNFPSDVDECLKVGGWESIADTPLQFEPTSSTVSPTAPLPISNISKDGPLTLRSLLTNHLDIMSIPRRSFFAHLAHFTNDEFQRNRLLEFTNPDYIDELYDYTTRPRRSILEVLHEFDTVKVPWQRICSIIPTIRGRQFSIASAQSPTAPPESRTQIELLIAIVKYRTVIKRIRRGVCTRYVESLSPGQQITVTLQRGGLGSSKAEAEKPVIMIGPGTGIAPMRSLIYQRRYWRKELGLDGNPATEILFFGCRNAESDYFFKDEWEALRKEASPLEVVTAFSRDQREKVYVQDKVREHGAVIYDALATKGGTVYICGSSGKMPQAVREALIEGFQKHGTMSREDAEEYLVAMEKSGRYKQETW